MSKARNLADFISTGVGTGILADGAISTTEITGVNATSAEINKLVGVTATSAEINKLTGVTASSAEINKLAGLTASTSELNNVVGSTSVLQTQLNNITVTAGTLTKSFLENEEATISLSASLSPAPVVSVTKEVPQSGISAKGAWDVNATGSNYDLHNTAANVTLTANTVYSSDADTLTYSSKTSSLQNSDSQAIAFKPDGTKYYDVSSGNVYEYSLSTAWDLSTSSYTTSYTDAAMMSNARGMYFKPDGTRFWLVGNDNNLYQYNLSTAWDLSTASDSSYRYNQSAYMDQNASTVYFKPDGTEFYLINESIKLIVRYAISTAWDITSTVSGFQLKYVNSELTYPKELTFNSTGTRMYVLDGADDKVYQYNLSTAFRPDTASYASKSFDASTQSSTMQGMFLRQDTNATLFLCSQGNAYEYSFGATNTLALGSGSFASTDVGKRIVGNGGDVILTSTGGAFSTTGGSSFTDNSTIAAGSWTMQGLKSAGASSGLTISGIAGAAYNFAALSGSPATNTSSTATSSNNVRTGMNISPDGTKLVVMDNQAPAYFQSYTMSTAYDLSTLTHVNTAQKAVAPTSVYVNDRVVLGFSPDGTKAGYATDESHRLGWYSLSTPWDMGTATDQGSWDPGSNFSFQLLLWNGDGSNFYVYSNNGYWLTYKLVGDAYKVRSSYVASTVTSNRGQVGMPTNTHARNAHFNGDGTKFFVTASNHKIYQTTLSTPYDIESNTGSAIVLYDDGNNATMACMALASDGSYMINASATATTLKAFRLQNLVIPTTSYHVSTTGSTGQINTTYWTDINSMTADEAAGGGEVYYAVSTDNKTTWSVAKSTDGVRPIVRNSSGTWQYNNNVGTSNSNNLSVAAYNNDSFTFSNVGGTATVGAFWSTDGTKVFIMKGNYVAEALLTTAYDLSTATYQDLADLSPQDSVPFGFWMNSTGTRMYVNGGSNDTIYQYSLSTGFDLTGLSYTGVSINVQSQDTENRGIWFGPENASNVPTKMFMVGGANNTVYEYGFTSAGNLSTASYSNVSFSVASEQGDCSGLSFSADGTKMFIIGRSPEGVHQYNLTTAWDISSASYANIYYDTTGFITTPYSGGVSSNGEHLVIADSSSGYIYNISIGGSAYATTATWVNGTVNDELYTLQQALTAQAFNRMDKTQLDAVADANHFVLGNTLDLAIGLRMSSASTSVPTSDGVSINYDAAILQKGAVLGTDYDYNFPASNSVIIKSLATQNLKVRVV